MFRGRLMVSLVKKKDVSAVESIESTDTSKDENSNQMEISKKRNSDHFEVLHESTNTANDDTLNQMVICKKRNRDQFEVNDGAELIKFKRKLRRRNRPIHYACSEEDDGDFSADELSDEYLPPQLQDPRAQYNDSNCSDILSDCQVHAEENNMEINPLITLNDLRVGLASNQNSYFCLDSDITAELDNKETTNKDLNVDNNVEFSTFNVTPATAKNVPVSPDILNNVDQSCNPERRKLDITTTDPCSIGSSHQNLSLSGTASNVKAPIMTDILDQEEPVFNNEDLSSFSMKRQDPAINTDPCSIGSSHQNLSLSGTASNVKAPIMTDILDQEEPIFNNEDLSSFSMKRQDPAINTDPCSIGSSHQNMSRSSTSSNLEVPITTDTLHQEEPLLTNEDPSCSSERREPQIPTDPCSSANDRDKISKSTKRVYPKKSCPGRKRQRDPKNWKMNKLKTLRNLGLEYTNKKGKLVKKRALGPGCKTDKDCIRKCHTNISNDHRTNLFTLFWAMGDHDKQVLYLSRFLTRVQRKTVQLNNINSRRQYTYEYYLPALGEKVRVCKKMFLDTFSITDMWITTMFKKMDESNEEVIPNDRRGKHCNRGNAINENIKISVRQHINSIPVKESHYVRQRTSKLYFEESLTFPKLYSLYAEWMTENKPNDAKATQEQYRQIFYKEFNIDFFKPKKDQCLKCEVHQKASESEKETTAIDYALHIANKSIVREIKENDKAEAKQLKKTLITACFDLQKILTTPQSDVSTFYYKRKFQVFNFTIYDIGSAEGHCYVWDECIGKKGPNEIASFLFDFIKQKALQGIKEFRFYSDCCGGQNRNRIIFLMYAYASKIFGVNIKHSFFEVGHSQSEGDSMHALIERRKKNQVVYVPQQWYTLIRCAKSTGKPYAVKEVNQNDIFDFKSLLNLVPNWELDKDKRKMMWSKVNYIEINMQSPNIINFQNDFYSDLLNWIDLDYHKVKTRRLNKNKNLDTLWSHTLAIAYESLHPITQSKYKDLMSLCSSGAIPEQYRMFYVNLPHSNTVTNTVDSDIED